MSDNTALVAVDMEPMRPALLRPVATPQEIIGAHRDAARIIAEALEEGVDYGVVPGTGTKPSLLKPGAERLCIAFGAAPVYEVVNREIDHDRVVQWSKRKKLWSNRQFIGWEEETGESLGLYRFEVRCRLVSRTSGEMYAEGIGVCSTMESKYVDRPRDCENTALKMAQKRALVAAVLNGFGLSARFTQDVEDLPRVNNDADAEADSRQPKDKPAQEPPKSKREAVAACCAKAKAVLDITDFEEAKAAYIAAGNAYDEARECGDITDNGSGAQSVEAALAKAKEHVKALKVAPPADEAPVYPEEVQALLDAINATSDTAEIDAFCQQADALVDSKAIGATSAAAKALHKAVADARKRAEEWGR